MRKTPSVPYGNRTVSETGDSVRIEWICRNAMNLAGNVGRRRDRAPEIEETEPSV
jgi:hypothetical protein